MDQQARRNVFLVAGALVALSGVGFLLRAERSPPSTAKDPPVAAAPRATNAPSPLAPAATLDRARLRDQFVGSAACAPCHRSETAAYAKSHHAKALVPATSAEVSANFAASRFSTPLGGTTRFTTKNGGFEVTSPNAAGASQTFPIAYAAGVFPLQQYIVRTERGKLQTLQVSWDTRPADEGGQRWFHAYGPQGIAPGDSLFFTQPALNWNHVCADCHSTLLERRYTPENDTFDTRWAELAVGCEGCHGPGAQHVRAAKAGGGSGTSSAPTLTVALTRSSPWAPSATGSPMPRVQDGTEVEVCAPCHSRRVPLHEGFVAGDAFLDAFEPELLRPGRYHADGQVEGEVYEWGSFLQSKMYASGVRCSDCHEPHSAELYVAGNALCTRCHAAGHFDVPAHSHHTAAKAPRCIDCHMPPDTFMQIDERRDHSIRIPRPDLSAEFGTPNACNGCHAKQSAAWAVEQLAAWFPNSKHRPHFVEALARDRKGTVDAPRALAALASDAMAPAIARATALEALGQYATAHGLETLRTALSSPDPLVVYGAVRGASALPLDERASLLLPVVDHPRRAVRIAVGQALSALPVGQLPKDMRASLERDFDEVIASLVLNASLPQSHVERSAFELARHHPEAAESELLAALRLQPCLVEAHLNLADLARGQGDEARAEREIRAALACDPRSAHAHHALGLLDVRTGKKREALASLRKAVELAPDDARFSYVLAAATAESGDVEGAVKILEAAVEKRPNDRQLLEALGAYLQKLGRIEAAADTEERLRTLENE
jgi:predicted CXXCH cytochrome family protein